MNRDSEESESWHGLGSATGPRRRGPAPCHGGNPSQHGFKFKLSSFRVYHDHGLYSTPSLSPGPGAGARASLVSLWSLESVLSPLSRQARARQATARKPVSTTGPGPGPGPGPGSLGNLKDDVTSD